MAWEISSAMPSLMPELTTVPSRTSRLDRLWFAPGLWRSCWMKVWKLESYRICPAPCWPLSCCSVRLSAPVTRLGSGTF